MRSQCTQILITQITSESKFYTLFSPEPSQDHSYHPHHLHHHHCHPTADLVRVGGLLELVASRILVGPDDGRHSFAETGGCALLQQTQ